MNSDERARVAREMRYVAHDPGICHGWGLGSLVNSILTDGAPTPTTPQALLLAFADLIDPTCTMRDIHWDDGQCTWGCICSACGAKHEHECARYLKFCSKCGARVVRDHE